MSLFKKVLSSTLAIAYLSTLFVSQNAFAMKAALPKPYRIPFIDHSEMSATQFPEIDQLTYQTAENTLDTLQRVYKIQSKISTHEMLTLKWDIIIAKIRYAQNMFSIGLMIPTQNYVYYDSQNTIFTERTKQKIVDLATICYSINQNFERQFATISKKGVPLHLAAPNLMEVHFVSEHLLGGLLELAEITHIPIPQHIKVRTVL